MKLLWPIGALLLAASLAFAAPAEAQAPATPNFIFILADDMGYGDVAHAGGKFPTPHLDRLRAEGMRFTDAHTTSSVCTPTRYSILTGRYNWRSPLKKSVLFPPKPSIMDPERLTVAKFLQDHGYTTFAVGKWHLGLNWHMLDEPAKAGSGPTQGSCWDIDFSKPPKLGPLKLGFTHDFLFPASLDMAPYLYLRDDVPVGKPTVTKGWNRKGPATPDFEADQCLIDFARESRAFIRQGAGAKKPFFLYLPLTSPHTPIVPSKKWLGKSGFGKYGDFVMETDWVVGEVLAELDVQGVADNTFVLFTCDNGCSPQAKIPELAKKGHKCNGDWRGHKADIYEGGHRVPFLVRWPGRVKAGSTCDLTACTADFFATVAEILGKQKALPNNAAEDSFSLVPALTTPGHDTPVRPFTIHHSINGSFAIRKGDWKLCLCPGSGGWSDPRPNKALKDKSLPAVQLFNLAEDPGEQKNLEAKHPKVVDDLVATLVTAIAQGRTRPGDPSPNDGRPDTFPGNVLRRFPSLEEPGRN
ncbi:MAG: arylsulfatase [Akkermansiaceae bacterium]|nr:arylsulfatase [Akkermansiaceae bacterium]